MDSSSRAPDEIQGDPFLSAILEQLWAPINAAGCQAVREQVEPALKEQLPAPFKNIHFTKLDFGKVPLRLDNIVVYDEQDGALQFDVDIVWNGECEIELDAKIVGKIGVKTIKFNGRMAIILKPLLNVLPIAGAVQFYFIDPPSLQLDFTGVADVADSKLISGTIRKVIDDVIASLLVPPNRMIVKLDPTISLFDIYQPPVGVARIYVVEGEGFKAQKQVIRKDIPDVYCKLSVAKSNVYHSRTIKDSETPKWGNDDFGDFLLFDKRQTLSLQAWEQDPGRDDFLGSATVSIQKLLQQGDGTLKLDLNDKSNKCTGASITVRCNLVPLTTASADSLSTQKASSNILAGVLTILVKQAFGIPPETPSFVKVKYGKAEFQTPTVVPPVEGDTGTPCYDSVYHIPISTEESTTKGGLHDIVLRLGLKGILQGKIIIPCADLVKTPNLTIREKRDAGNGILLEFHVSLNALQL